MTKRPTDDFQISDRDHGTEFDFGDDDDAAFGGEKNAEAGTDDVTAAGTPSTTAADEGDIAENYDDSDFALDDAEDVIDEEAEQEYAEFQENAEHEDDLHDPLSEEDPYPTTEEIYDVADNGNQSMSDKLKAMKKGDYIFYGGLGLVAVGALYAAFALTMGQEPPPVENILNANTPQMAGEPTTTDQLQVPADGSAPIEAAAEPKPDVIGIQGAQSTLNNDTMAVLPQPTADAPPAPDAAAPAPAVNAAQPAAEQPQPVEQQPVAAPAAAPAPVANAAQPAAQAPLPAQIPAELQAQLDAQQQAMNAMQAQMEAQQKVMQKGQEQAAIAMAQPASVGAVTAPPAVSAKDPALNEVATDLNVRITEVNAKLTQLADTINNLQKTANKLDKQNSDLVNKTKELQDKVGTQSSKISELANKEPAPSTDKATLEQLKVGIGQMEKKLASLTKTQSDLKEEQDKLATRTAQQVAAATAAPRPMMPPPSQQAPSRVPEKLDVPAQPQHVLKAPATATATTTVKAAPAAEPRSPKARDLAGLSNDTAAGNTWVLRAATPTMAWLSPRPGSAELKRVAPGDKVDGIGQILEIRQEMGKWAVIGTAGTIR